MPITIDDLGGPSNPLATHYSRFDVANRLLLTGHSHQAWPDVALTGQEAAWSDAARLVDAKWERAFAMADRVREGYRALLGEPGGEIALGGSTHELLVRFLSALPLRERPRLVTTDGEFHTIRRQLDRLAEEGVEVVRVSADPPESIPERLAAAADDRTAAVLVSTVLFQNARRVPGLDAVLSACLEVGTELLLDVYHQLNVVPFSLRHDGLGEAFVIGGGYKYCQLGEGVCFLRIPPGRERLRPVVTGWFSEFSALSEQMEDGRVAYGEGADRFAGSTYDPTSHYRAAAVFDFFEREGLTPELLREISQHQVGSLAAAFDQADLPSLVIDRDRDTPLSEIGGFLALRAPRADELAAALRRRGVLTDARGDMLRLGPAPYLRDDQLFDSVAVLAEVVSQYRADAEYG